MNIEKITGLKVRQIADACELTVQAVYKWEKNGEIPADYVLRICQAAKWQKSPHALRPDIYPNPEDGIPKDVCIAHCGPN